MANILLIHGLEGNGNENWFPWLREKLTQQGYNVITPRFPTPDNQSLESWMDIFKDYKKYLNEDSIMVGHSLGCPFILNLLETINVKIKSAFLVAPFANLLGIEYIDNLNKTFVDKEFNWNKIKGNCNEFYIYYSDNDPYVPEKEGIEILKNTQGIERRVNNAEHFNLKAGYDKFELLLEDIERHGEKNMNEFDIKAPNWDSDPAKVERARRVVEVIKKTIELTKDMTAFEYGCGTGLLSFNLYPYVNSIYLEDSAEGMLSVLNEKITEYHITNMITSNIDLTKQTNVIQNYDLIYTLMTLHHIKDVDRILNIFYKMLNQSGYLCIADLDEEDGSFHGEGFDGHNGFNKEDLEKKLMSAGFQIRHYEICFGVPQGGKDPEDKNIRRYPLFVMIAQKEDRE